MSILYKLSEPENSNRIITCHKKNPQIIVNRI